MNKKKLVFIHNPKVAGTSIRRTLEAIGTRDNLKVGSTEHDDIILLPRQDNSILDHPYDVPPMEFIDEIYTEFNKTRKFRTVSDYFDICNIVNVLTRIDLDNAFVFMFFRDVVDRVTSAYKHNIDRSMHDSKYFRVDSTVQTIDDYINNVIQYRGNHYDVLDFDTTIFHNTSNILNLHDSLHRRADYYNNTLREHNITAYDLHHSVPNQTSLIPGYEKLYFGVYDVFTDVKIDYKGLYHNLTKDWSTLLNILDINHMDLLHRNKSKHSSDVQLSDQLKSLVLDSFSTDHQYINEI